MKKDGLHWMMLLIVLMKTEEEEKVLDAMMMKMIQWMWQKKLVSEERISFGLVVLVVACSVKWPIGKWAFL